MASNLTRRENYFPEMFNFRRNFDDVINRLFTVPYDRFGSSDLNTAWIPPVESYFDQNRFHVRVALPGVSANDVNVQAHGNELVINGERKQTVTPSDERSFQREIIYGAFERVIPLPEGVQTEKIDANFNNGVLEITAPLSEKATPRKIEIKSSESSGRKLAA